MYAISTWLHVADSMAAKHEVACSLCTSCHLPCSWLFVPHACSACLVGWRCSGVSTNPLRCLCTVYACCCILPPVHCVHTALASAHPAERMPSKTHDPCNFMRQALEYTWCAQALRPVLQDCSDYVASCEQHMIVPIACLLCLEPHNTACYAQEHFEISAKHQ